MSRARFRVNLHSIEALRSIEIYFKNVHTKAFPRKQFSKLVDNTQDNILNLKNESFTKMS